MDTVTLLARDGQNATLAALVAEGYDLVAADGGYAVFRKPLRLVSKPPEQPPGERVVYHHDEPAPDAR